MPTPHLKYNELISSLSVNESELNISSIFSNKEIASKW